MNTPAFSARTGRQIHSNPRTTSRLEGVNAQIRDLLRQHRGVSKEHRRRAVERFLIRRELGIADTIETAGHVPKITAAQRPNDQVSQVIYDAGMLAEKGVWARPEQV